MKKILKIFPVGIVAMFPTLIFAQTLDWFSNLVSDLADVVQALIPVLIALAFVVFVWGLIGFIFASGDEEAKEEGKRRMIWGVIALFVIVSIWGIISLLQTMTGADSTTGVYPTWNTTSS